ncbi:iron-sulfur cluster assembly scaffold protein [Rathayibacter sp. SD072]|uniref:iron-sulfur cluster assembly scaffold protein n=1 Tax=Rathayibacter sp. SD072 TaxID=2781731 RepID=UPI001A979056|nr:iron-sulfur cluster assembly scaffold protein [Rathayibacter sp. SD072]MBO0982272.1 iron-sulfur cluster assembly scaffold protein [Rathayibacter sp. SD072]
MSAVEAADLIRAHARHPIGRIDEDVTEEVLGRAELLTPTCGDRLVVRIVRVDDSVSLRWTGRGCELSQGSASLLVDELDGLDEEALRARVGAFLTSMRLRVADPVLGDEEALLAVAANPVRSVCATLAWRALGDALDQAGPS